MQIRVIIVMGVSGSGKSTLGRRLAHALHASFIEGDDCHPATNVAKMQAGVPLDDDDRWPWLARVAQAATQALEADGQAVCSCSALKLAYRDYLRARIAAPACFLCLDANAETLRVRLKARQGHFMPDSLLDSQLRILERPTDGELAQVLDVRKPPDVLLAEALTWLRTHPG